MNLSAQKIHSETIPDKQADKALMPENLSSLTLYVDQPLLDSYHIYPDHPNSKESPQKD